jgi:SAM-dependent methyltransferase
VSEDLVTDGSGGNRLHENARRFFDELWSQGDPWDLETSELDQHRYTRQIELLADRRYATALEIGCAAGAFTRQLAPLCDATLAMDISSAAIEDARECGAGPSVEFRVQNVMEFDAVAEGPWDLVVLTETAYYLGWLYPLFEVGWLAHWLHQATAHGGRLLLANTFGPDHGIMSPWLIQTYRDLFLAVGYELTHEEKLAGVKETVPMEILVSVFEKTIDSAQDVHH